MDLNYSWDDSNIAIGLIFPTSSPLEGFCLTITISKNTSTIIFSFLFLLFCHLLWPCVISIPGLYKVLITRTNYVVHIYMKQEVGPHHYVGPAWKSYAPIKYPNQMMVRFHVYNNILWGSQEKNDGGSLMMFAV